MIICIKVITSKDLYFHFQNAVYTKRALYKVEYKVQHSLYKKAFILLPTRFAILYNATLLHATCLSYEYVFDI